MTQSGEGTAAGERTEGNPGGTLELVKWNAQVAGLEMAVLEHGVSSDGLGRAIANPARLDRALSSRALGV